MLHSDRGAPMTSKCLAQLLADLDVARSFSRPHTNNDNPFSESHFKTAKYHPTYPGQFATLDEALAWGRSFFSWYNHEHRHSGIAYLTPADVYRDRTEARLADRHAVLHAAYADVRISEAVTASATGAQNSYRQIYRQKRPLGADIRR